MSESLTDTIDNTPPPYRPYGVPAPPTRCESCELAAPMRFMGQYMQNYDPQGTVLETGYECRNCGHKHFICEPFVKPPSSNGHCPNQETGVPPKA